LDRVHLSRLRSTQVVRDEEVFDRQPAPEDIATHHEVWTGAKLQIAPCRIYDEDSAIVKLPSNPRNEIREWGDLARWFVVVSGVAWSASSSRISDEGCYPVGTTVGTPEKSTGCVSPYAELS